MPIIESHNNGINDDGVSPKEYIADKKNIVSRPFSEWECSPL